MHIAINFSHFAHSHYRFRHQPKRITISNIYSLLSAPLLQSSHACCTTKGIEDSSMTLSFIVHPGFKDQMGVDQWNTRQRLKTAVKYSNDHVAKNKALIFFQRLQLFALPKACVDLTPHKCSKFDNISFLNEITWTLMHLNQKKIS